MKDVVGIGNAIVDVLADVDDGFLETHGLAKGAMTLVDAAESERLYGLIGIGVECSGGSAANTMVGLASLGGSGAYIGRVRDDELGRVFVRDMAAAGIDFPTPPVAVGPPTGRCIVLVTPDAQRTLQTYLGVSARLEPSDVDPGVVRDARITYLEGYLWDAPPAKAAFLEAARIAHGAGRKVALSLSDAFCVDRHRDEFRTLIESHVDVLFANEDEIKSLHETDDFDAAVRDLRDRVEIAAITRGSRGSVALSGERVVEADAEPVEQVVDTTGAGDLYAAGFLFGLTRGCDLAQCARMGGIAAGEIIGHFGARPEQPLSGLVDAAPGSRREETP